jgi:hypothetical protein
VVERASRAGQTINRSSSKKGKEERTMFNPPSNPAAFGIGRSFTDEYNRPATLTESEVQYFDSTVKKVLSATGFDIPVFTADHDKLEGKHRDALGVHVKAFDGSEEFIMVDCYFVHESYRAAFEGAYDLNGISLLEVLCHEVAHIKYSRHSKYHAALTAAYVNMCN